MNEKNVYCYECDELVPFEVNPETIEEEFRGVNIKYLFNVGRCAECGEEVAVDLDYEDRKSEAKIRAYREACGIIQVEEIEEILRKYDVGKEPLAEILGFGKVTIKRYFDGFVPDEKYSDIMYKALNDESYFYNLFQRNKDELKPVAIRKIEARKDRLEELAGSKMLQAVNYIVTNLDEVTPLAMEKLLSFSEGVNYVLNGNQLLPEPSQAWQHGPVYPSVYMRYKRYGYKPINDGIDSSHGCMQSLLSEEEKKAIDLVLQTFGMFSPKVLEEISHLQDPWKEKRAGLDSDSPSSEIISEETIKSYYTGLNLNSKESIMYYIFQCTKNIYG